MKLLQLQEARYANDPIKGAWVAVSYADPESGTLLTEFVVEDTNPSHILANRKQPIENVSRQEGIDRIRNAFFDGPIEPATHSEQTLREYRNELRKFELYTQDLSGQYYFSDWVNYDDYDAAELVFIPH